MKDKILETFPWITNWLKVELPDYLVAETKEHKIMTEIKERWGRSDTKELLNDLKKKYGNDALKAMEMYIDHNIRKDWKKMGIREGHRGTEMEDFFRVLWEPLKNEGFEYSIKKEGNKAEFCVTKCPFHELAKMLEMQDWMFILSCSGDKAAGESFCNKISFYRTKTLMEGNDCCNHQYYYK